MCMMVNGLHLYSTFILSAVQFMPLIHLFTHQWRLAAMQGTNQLIRSNWGLDDSSYLLSHLVPFDDLF